MRGLEGTWLGRAFRCQKSKFIYTPWRLLWTLDSSTSLYSIKMTSSVKRKRTEPPVGLDTDDDTSTETRESKRGRYDTPNSLEAGSPQNPAQNSLFLNLPLELRLQIYDLLLVSRIIDGKAPFESMAKDYQRPVLLTSGFAWIWDPSIFPAILQSCQKIYNEALPVLYGNNIFEFDDSAYITRSAD